MTVIKCFFGPKFVKISYLCPMIGDFTIDIWTILSDDKYREERENLNFGETIFMAFYQYCQEQFKFKNIFKTNAKKHIKNDN